MLIFPRDPTMLLLYVLLFLFGTLPCVSAAAFHTARQDHTLSVQQKCPVATVYSYITVTVTDAPPAVTVAVPDYSSISKSLASAHSIDSLVVVEQSQNRPVDAPPNTIVPTFVYPIVVPAVEATEIPHDGTSVVYLPDNSAPPHNVVIGTSIDSIILSPWGSTATVDATTADPASATQSSSSLPKSFTAPWEGWNATGTSTTDILPTTGTRDGVNGSPTSTMTETTYVSTATDLVTVTSVPSNSSYGPSGYGSMVKRQTCVLISAQIGGQWASWCNNWDGSTTYTYTSWETTVTPGVLAQPSNGPTSSSTSTSTQAATTTVAVTEPPSTMTETMASVSLSETTQLASSSVSPPNSTTSSCGETGAFSISFDNLPKQSVFDNSTAGLPPIFNPFEHFYWANGWSYLPPPNDPYPPHDGSQLAIYVPTDQSMMINSDIGTIPLGGFSAGSRSPNDTYWFDAQYAWVGCDNSVTDPSNMCDFVAEAYRYDGPTNTNQLVATEHFTQPLCTNSPCRLTQIFFTENFSQLSGMSFYAKIGPTVRTFYLDNLQLSWWNSTCEAGQLRASSRK